uniref:Genome polyprotein n=1 Tax=Gecarcinus lateralis associated flavi-like virus TaxID=3142494 RepID=A0AAT9JFW1_9FLAV
MIIADCSPPLASVLANVLPPSHQKSLATKSFILATKMSAVAVATPNTRAAKPTHYPYGEPKGFSRLAVASDGNCQFGAVCAALWGRTPTTRETDKMRSRVVASMRRHALVYRAWEPNFPAYLTQMAKVGEWGDELTLKAMADLLHVNIHVHSGVARNWVVQAADWFGETIHVVYNNKHYDALLHKTAAPEVVEDTTPAEEKVLKPNPTPVAEEAPAVVESTTSSAEEASPKNNGAPVVAEVATPRKRKMRTHPRFVETDKRQLRNAANGECNYTAIYHHRVQGGRKVAIPYHRVTAAQRPADLPPTPRGYILVNGRHEPHPFLDRGSARHRVGNKNTHLAIIRPHPDIKIAQGKKACRALPEVGTQVWASSGKELYHGQVRLVDGVKKIHFEGSCSAIQKPWLDQRQNAATIREQRAIRNMARNAKISRLLAEAAQNCKAELRTPVVNEVQRGKLLLKLRNFQERQSFAQKTERYEAAMLQHLKNGGPKPTKPICNEEGIEVSDENTLLEKALGEKKRAPKTGAGIQKFIKQAGIPIMASVMRTWNRGVASEKGTLLDERQLNHLLLTHMTAFQALEKNMTVKRSGRIIFKKRSVAAFRANIGFNEDLMKLFRKRVDRYNRLKVKAYQKDRLVDYYLVGMQKQEARAQYEKKLALKKERDEAYLKRQEKTKQYKAALNLAVHEKQLARMERYCNYLERKKKASEKADRAASAPIHSHYVASIIEKTVGIKLNTAKDPPPRKRQRPKVHRQLSKDLDRTSNIEASVRRIFADVKPITARHLSQDCTPGKHDLLGLRQGVSISPSDTVIVNGRAHVVQEAVTWPQYKRGGGVKSHYFHAIEKYECGTQICRLLPGDETKRRSKFPPYEVISAISQCIALGTAGYFYQIGLETDAEQQVDDTYDVEGQCMTWYIPSTTQGDMKTGDGESITTRRPVEDQSLELINQRRAAYDFPEIKPIRQYHSFKFLDECMRHDSYVDPFQDQLGTEVAKPAWEYNSIRYLKEEQYWQEYQKQDLLGQTIGTHPVLGLKPVLDLIRKSSPDIEWRIKPRALHNKDKWKEKLNSEFEPIWIHDVHDNHLELWHSVTEESTAKEDDAIFNDTVDHCLYYYIARTVTENDEKLREYLGDGHGDIGNMKFDVVVINSDDPTSFFIKSITPTKDEVLNYSLFNSVIKLAHFRQKIGNLIPRTDADIDFVIHPVAFVCSIYLQLLTQTTEIKRLHVYLHENNSITRLNLKNIGVRKWRSWYNLNRVQSFTVESDRKLPCETVFYNDSIQPVSIVSQRSGKHYQVALFYDNISHEDADYPRMTMVYNAGRGRGRGQGRGRGRGARTQPPPPAPPDRTNARGRGSNLRARGAPRGRGAVSRPPPPPSVNPGKGTEPAKYTETVTKNWETDAGNVNAETTRTVTVTPRAKGSPLTLWGRLRMLSLTIVVLLHMLNLGASVEPIVSVNGLNFWLHQTNYSNILSCSVGGVNKTVEPWQFAGRKKLNSSLLKVKDGSPYNQGLGSKSAQQDQCIDQMGEIQNLSLPISKILRAIMNKVNYGPLSCYKEMCWVNDKSITQRACIISSSSATSREKWSYCPENHPCKVTNQTRGHLIDKKLGGPHWCINCMPQTLKQQEIQDQFVLNCPTYCVNVRPSSQETSGYSYIYECLKSIDDFVTKILGIFPGASALQCSDLISEDTITCFDPIVGEEVSTNYSFPHLNQRTTGMCEMKLEGLVQFSPYESKELLGVCNGSIAYYDQGKYYSGFTTEITENDYLNCWYCNAVPNPTSYIYQIHNFDVILNLFYDDVNNCHANEGLLNLCVAPGSTFPSFKLSGILTRQKIEVLDKKFSVDDCSDSCCCEGMLGNKFDMGKVYIFYKDAVYSCLEVSCSKLEQEHVMNYQPQLSTACTLGYFPNETALKMLTPRYDNFYYACLLNTHDLEFYQDQHEYGFMLIFIVAVLCIVFTAINSNMMDGVVLASCLLFMLIICADFIIESELTGIALTSAIILLSTYTLRINILLPILTVVLFSYSANAECGIEGYTHIIKGVQEDLSVLYQTDANVQSGSCFKYGNATLEVTKITQIIDYHFLYSTPLTIHFQESCHQYSCPGATAPTCNATCSGKKKTELQEMDMYHSCVFWGAECAACTGVGQYFVAGCLVPGESVVRAYGDPSPGEPVEIQFCWHEFGSTRNYTVKHGEDLFLEHGKLQILNFNSVSQIYPLTIYKHGLNFYCSANEADTHICYSKDLENSMIWDDECLNWKAERAYADYNSVSMEYHFDVDHGKKVIENSYKCNISGLNNMTKFDTALIPIRSGSISIRVEKPAKAVALDLCYIKTLSAKVAETGIQNNAKASTIQLRGRVATSCVITLSSPNCHLLSKNNYRVSPVVNVNLLMLCSWTSTAKLTVCGSNCKQLSITGVATNWSYVASESWNGISNATQGKIYIGSMFSTIGSFFSSLNFLAIFNHIASIGLVALSVFLIFNGMLTLGAVSAACAGFTFFFVEASALKATTVSCGVVSTYFVEAWLAALIWILVAFSLLDIPVNQVLKVVLNFILVACQTCYASVTRAVYQCATELKVSTYTDKISLSLLIIDLTIVGNCHLYVRFIWLAVTALTYHQYGKIVPAISCWFFYFWPKVTMSERKQLSQWHKYRGKSSNCKSNFFIFSVPYTLSHNGTNWEYTIGDTKIGSWHTGSYNKRLIGDIGYSGSIITSMYFWLNMKQFALKRNNIGEGCCGLAILEKGKVIYVGRKCPTHHLINEAYDQEDCCTKVKWCTRKVGKRGVIKRMKFEAAEDIFDCEGVDYMINAGNSRCQVGGGLDAKFAAWYRRNGMNMQKMLDDCTPTKECFKVIKTPNENTKQIYAYTPNFKEDPKANKAQEEAYGQVFQKIYYTLLAEGCSNRRTSVAMPFIGCGIFGGRSDAMCCTISGAYNDCIQIDLTIILCHNNQAAFIRSLKILGIELEPLHQSTGKVEIKSVTPKPQPKAIEPAVNEGASTSTAPEETPPTAAAETAREEEADEEEEEEYAEPDVLNTGEVGSLKKLVNKFAKDNNELIKKVIRLRAHYEIQDETEQNITDYLDMTKTVKFGCVYFVLATDVPLRNRTVIPADYRGDWSKQAEKALKFCLTSQETIGIEGDHRRLYMLISLLGLEQRCYIAARPQRCSSKIYHGILDLPFNDHDQNKKIMKSEQLANHYVFCTECHEGNVETLLTCAGSDDTPVTIHNHYNGRHWIATAKNVNYAIDGSAYIEYISRIADNTEFIHWMQTKDAITHCVKKFDCGIGKTASVVARDMTFDKMKGLGVLPDFFRNDSIGIIKIEDTFNYGYATITNTGIVVPTHVCSVLLRMQDTIVADLRPSSRGDCTTYGDVKFETPLVGQCYALCVVQHDHIVSLPVRCLLADDEGASFEIVEIVDDEIRSASLALGTLQGYCGCPIINQQGQLVACFNVAYNVSKENEEAVVAIKGVSQAQITSYPEKFAQAVENLDELSTGKLGWLVQAPTGAGKSTILPKVLAEQGKSVIILIPGRHAVKLLYQSYVVLYRDPNTMSCDTKISYEIGEKGDEKCTESFGEAERGSITIMTYGLYNAKPKVADILIMDELHDRDSADVIATHAAMEFGKFQRVFACSATGEALEKYFDPLVITGVSHRKGITVVQPQEEGWEVKSKHFEAKRFAKRYFDGVTLVFLPTKNDCTVGKQNWDLQKTGIPAHIWHSTEVPAEITDHCIIFCTNVLESSVTIKNCQFVIDSGKENAVRFEGGNYSNYDTPDPLSWVMEIKPNGPASAVQRRGRTGRDVDGYYYRCNIGHSKVDAWPAQHLIDFALKGGEVSTLLDEELGHEIINARAYYPIGDFGDYYKNYRGEIPALVAFFGGIPQEWTQHKLTLLKKQRASATLFNRLSKSLKDCLERVDYYGYNVEVTAEQNGLSTLDGVSLMTVGATAAYALWYKLAKNTAYKTVSTIYYWKREDSGSVMATSKKFRIALIPRKDLMAIQLVFDKIEELKMMGRDADETIKERVAARSKSFFEEVCSLLLKALDNIKGKLGTAVVSEEEVELLETTSVTAETNGPAILDAIWNADLLDKIYQALRWLKLVDLNNKIIVDNAIAVGASGIYGFLYDKAEKVLGRAGALFATCVAGYYLVTKAAGVIITSGVTALVTYLFSHHIFKDVDYLGNATANKCIDFAIGIGVGYGVNYALHRGIQEISAPVASVMPRNGIGQGLLLAKSIYYMLVGDNNNFTSRIDGNLIQIVTLICNGGALCIPTAITVGVSAAAMRVILKKILIFDPIERHGNIRQTGAFERSTSWYDNIDVDQIIEHFFIISSVVINPVSAISACIDLVFQQLTLPEGMRKGWANQARASLLKHGGLSPLYSALTLFSDLIKLMTRPVAGAALCSAPILVQLGTVVNKIASNRTVIFLAFSKVIEGIYKFCVKVIDGGATQLADLTVDKLTIALKRKLGITKIEEAYDVAKEKTSKVLQPISNYWNGYEVIETDGYRNIQIISDICYVRGGKLQPSKTYLFGVDSDKDHLVFVLMSVCYDLSGTLTFVVPDKVMCAIEKRKTIRLKSLVPNGENKLLKFVNGTISNKFLHETRNVPIEYENEDLELTHFEGLMEYHDFSEKYGIWSRDGSISADLNGRSVLNELWYRLKLSSKPEFATLIEKYESPYTAHVPTKPNWYHSSRQALQTVQGVRDLEQVQIGIMHNVNYNLKNNWRGCFKVDNCDHGVWFKLQQLQFIENYTKFVQVNAQDSGFAEMFTTLATRNQFLYVHSAHDLRLQIGGLNHVARFPNALDWSCSRTIADVRGKASYDFMYITFDGSSKTKELYQMVNNVTESGMCLIKAHLTKSNFEAASLVLSKSFTKIFVFNSKYQRNDFEHVYLVGKNRGSCKADWIEHVWQNILDEKVRRLLNSRSSKEALKQGVELPDIKRTNIEAPAANRISVRDQSEYEDFKINGKVTQRLMLIKELKLLKRRWRDTPARRFEHLQCLGSFNKKVGTITERHTVNKNISDNLYNLFGWTPENSAVGHTQSDPQSIQRSMSKRLDFQPTDPTKEMQQTLLAGLDHMPTPEGKKMYGKFRLMPWDDMVIMANKQGAGGMFDEQRTMGDFLARPDARSIIESDLKKLHNDELLPYYDTVREKREPKIRKDVDEWGQLNYKTKFNNEEAIAAGKNLDPRFIQYGDIRSRIVDYQLLGRLLQHHKAQKLYHGSLSGLPPMLLGGVLRAIFDCYNPAQCRQVLSDMYEETGIDMRDSPKIFSESACGASGDYSSWDNTVSLFDLYLEYKFVKKFLHPELHNILKNRYRHKMYSICFTDYGDCYLRIGQRGSGDLMTSFGNTLLNALYCHAAEAVINGRLMRDQLRPVGSITYVKETKYKEDMTYDLDKCKKGKIYLFKTMTHIADGDDNLHFGSYTNIKRYALKAPEILGDGGKIIRSATQGGFDVSEDFEKLSFCSNKYVKNFIGPAVCEYRNDGIDIQQKDRYRRIMWMPARPHAEIFGKLGCTLKVHTAAAPDTERAITDTYSKLLSYLILYPHFLSVRAFCLLMLSTLVKPDYKISLFGRKYDLSCDTTTISSALYSVYGVTDFKDIFCVSKHFEKRGMSALIANTKLMATSQIRYKNNAKAIVEWFKSTYDIPLGLPWSYIYSKLPVANCVYYITRSFAKVASLKRHLPKHWSVKHISYSNELIEGSNTIARKMGNTKLLPGRIYIADQHSIIIGDQRYTQPMFRMPKLQCMVEHSFGIYSGKDIQYATARVPAVTKEGSSGPLHNLYTSRQNPYNLAAQHLMSHLAHTNE